MKQFLFKLLPRRPSFSQDMTVAERKIMEEHVHYWTGLRDKGVAVAFGPVLDPRSVWGVAIVEVADEADPHALLPNDPVVRAGLGTVEAYPMPGAIVRK